MLTGKNVNKTEGFYNKSVKQELMNSNDSCSVNLISTIEKWGLYI